MLHFTCFLSQYELLEDKEHAHSLAVTTSMSNDSEEGCFSPDPQIYFFFFCLSVGTGLHLGFLPLYDVSDKYDNCEAGKPLGSHPVQCLPPPCLVHQHSLSSVWPLSGLHVECLFSLSLGRSSERQLRQFRGSYCPFPEGSRFLETCSCICEATGANGKRTEQFGLQFGKS